MRLAGDNRLCVESTTPAVIQRSAGHIVSCVQGLTWRSHLKGCAWDFEQLHLHKVEMLGTLCFRFGVFWIWGYLHSLLDFGFLDQGCLTHSVQRGLDGASATRMLWQCS